MPETAGLILYIRVILRLFGVFAEESMIVPPQIRMAFGNRFAAVVLQDELPCEDFPFFSGLIPDEFENGVLRAAFSPGWIGNGFCQDG